MYCSQRGIGETGWNGVKGEKHPSYSWNPGQFREQPGGGTGQNKEAER